MFVCVYSKREYDIESKDVGCITGVWAKREINTEESWRPLWVSSKYTTIFTLLMDTFCYIKKCHIGGMVS